MARGLNEKKKKKTTDERKPHQLFLSNLDPLFFLPSKNSFRPRCVPPRLVPFLVLFLLFSVVWKEREKEREGERERGTGWGKEKRKNFSSSSPFFGSLFSSPTLFALYPPLPLNFTSHAPPPPVPFVFRPLLRTPLFPSAFDTPHSLPQLFVFNPQVQSFFQFSSFFFFSKTSKNGGKKKKKNFQYPQPLPSPRDQHERSAPPAHTQKTKAVRSPQLPPVTPFPKLRNSPFCFCTHTKKTRPLEIVLKHDEKKKKKKTLDPNSPCIKLTKVKNKNDIALRFSRSSPSRTTAD